MNSPGVRALVVEHLKQAYAFGADPKRAPQGWTIQGKAADALLASLSAAGWAVVPREPSATRWDMWLPIESAPLDGTSVLLLIDNPDHALHDEYPYAVSIGSYGTNGGPEHDPTWCFAGWDWCQDVYRRGAGTPTHWRPLPSPPAMIAAGEARGQ